MEVIVIILLFGIFCILGLQLQQLKRFTDHICKPPLQQQMIMYDPYGYPPTNGGGTNTKNDDTIGFKKDTK